MEWFAISDLHGKRNRYESLMQIVEREAPTAVLIGGDIFPLTGSVDLFLERYLFGPISELQREGIQTRFIVILGNDDPRVYETLMINAQRQGLLSYIPKSITKVSNIPVVGYPYIHPSPFLLKDWELYDVSRYIDPGCISPLEGIRTLDIDPGDLKYRTIKDDLLELLQLSDPLETIYLFHSPPYDTFLDKADIEGQYFEHVPLDPHIGSISVRKFIEDNNPKVTIHGHVHESFELTGKFFQRIGGTLCISACGKEKGLVLIRFDPDGSSDPVREVI